MLRYLFLLPLIVGCEAENKPDYQKEYNEIVQVYDTIFVEQIDDVEKDYESVDEKILRLPWMYGELPFRRADEKLKSLYNQYKNEITLPLHTNMTDEQVDYVIKNFVEIINM